MSKFTALNLSPDKIDMKYLSIPIKPDTTIRDINTLLSAKFSLNIKLYRVSTNIKLLLEEYTIEQYLTLLSKVTNYQVTGFKVFITTPKTVFYLKNKSDDDKQLEYFIKHGDAENFTKLYKSTYGENYQGYYLTVALRENQSSIIDFLLQLENFPKNVITAALLIVCENNKYTGSYRLGHKIVEMIKNDPIELDTLASGEISDLYSNIYVQASDAGFWDIAVWSSQYFKMKYEDRDSSDTIYHELREFKYFHDFHRGSKLGHFYSKNLQNLQNMYYSDIMSNMSCIRMYLLLLAFKYNKKILIEWLGNVDDNLKISNLNNDLKIDLLLVSLNTRHLDESIVLLLLNAGIKLQGIDIWKKFNTIYLNIDTIKLLLSSGATINMMRGLEKAVYYGNTDIACLFLDYGADIYEINNIDEDRRQYYLNYCNHPRVVSLQQKILQMIARGEVTDPKELKKLPPGLDLDPHRQAQEEKEYKEYKEYEEYKEYLNQK